MKKQFWMGALAMGALTVGIWGQVSSAEAALISGAPPACTAGNALSVLGATACSGSWQGNDSNQQADVLSELSAAFGGTTGSGSWIHNTLTDKSDSLNFGPFTSNPSGSTGTLMFDAAQKGYFAVALKASNSFSLYLFNGGNIGISSFNFTTAGTATNNQGKPQGLSHASLYYFDAQPVPTPALLPGLIGLGVAAVRRKKQAAEVTQEG